MDGKYPLVVNVYHSETGIFDSQTFILKVKAPKKLEVNAPSNKTDFSYAILGPSVSVPLPAYSVDEKRLAFTIEAGEGQTVPSFAKLAKDEQGRLCIKLEGQNVAEVGSY